MTKWEYRTVIFPAFKSDGLFAVPKINGAVDDTLRDYGNDGWELITQSFTADVSNNGLSDMLLIFKRPKE
jgi:hypothetical protein